jgi:hypothetical protein
MGRYRKDLSFLSKEKFKTKKRKLDIGDQNQTELIILSQTVLSLAYSSVLPRDSS